MQQTHSDRRRLLFIVVWTATTVVAEVLRVGATFQMGWPIRWDLLHAAGQMLVLGVVVRWHWWWAAATIGGAAARDGLLQSALGAAIRAFPAALSIVGALPQWLLLRSSGRRAVAWLIVQPVAAQIQRAIRSLFIAPGTFPNYRVASEWIPPTVLGAAASALLEAVVLAWILQPVFSAERSAEAPISERTMTPAVPPPLAAVRLCLILLVGLSIPIFMPQLFVKAYRPVFWRVIPLMAALFGPWLLALLMISRPRLHHPGLVLAASASLVALVPLVPYVGFATLLSGFMLDNRDQWLSYFATVGATTTLIAIAVTAVVSARRVPPAARAAWAWPASLTGSIVYGLLLATSISGLAQRNERRSTLMAHNDSLAHGQLNALADCAREYAERHPDLGFPTSMSLLAEGDSPCLDRTVAEGEAAGFQFLYVPAMPDTSGAVRAYTACAEPLEFLATGTNTVVIDETGVVRTGAAASEWSRTGRNCSAAWQDDLKAIKFCSARYAAMHPGAGYPAQLRELGYSGDRCLAATEGDRRVGDNSLNSGDGRYTYVPGPPDAAGRVVSYDIYVRRRGDWHELADHTGQVRGIDAPRLATPRDPLDSEVRARNRDRELSDPAMLERLCADGKADGCYVLARRLESRASQDQALTERVFALLQQSCSGGVGDACRALGHRLARQYPRDGEGARAAYQKGCDAGNGGACYELGGILAQQSPTADTRSLFERACDNQEGLGCLALARELDNVPANATLIELHLERGCDAGEPKACLMLADRFANTNPGRSLRLRVKGCAASDDKHQCGRYW